MTYDFRVASSNKPLYGHDSPQNAYMIDDYPSGFKARCRKRVWLEFKPKQGWRLVSQTSQKWYPGEEPAKDAPLNWNKPDASTYAPIAGCMYLDAQDHVMWDGLGFGSDAPKVLEFMGNYPQADFGGIKPFAAQRINELMASLLGRSVITINGVPKPPSDHALGEQRKELEQWAEVAKKTGLNVPQAVKDMVDGTAKPQQFDPAAFEQRQKLKQEQIEEAKAKAADAPGALNFPDFEARLRSKLKLEGRPLVVEPGGGYKAVIVFHNIEGAPSSSRFGGNRQEFVISGFDRDRNRAVAKIKVEMESNSIKSTDHGEYAANMAAYKATALKGKTATPREDRGLHGRAHQQDRQRDSSCAGQDGVGAVVRPDLKFLL